MKHYRNINPSKEVSIPRKALKILSAFDIQRTFHLRTQVIINKATDL
jgi:hypothetical protein